MTEYSTRLPPGRSPWFRRFGECPDATRRLICFHHAGGGPSLYREWQRSCRPHTEIWAVACPGREARMTEKPIDDMERLIDELAPLVPSDKPFAFFGHSLGAIVSFELARRLLKNGAAVPEHLFVSACPAPHVSRRPHSRAGYSNAEMVKELRGLGGTPSEILDHPDLMDMVMPLMRADFKLADEYVAPKDGHSRFAITAYGGSADAEVPLHKIHAWEHWADGRFASREFDGDHFYLNPHREALIDDLLRRWPARQEASPAAERAAPAERPAPFALAAAL